MYNVGYNYGSSHMTTPTELLDLYRNGPALLRRAVAGFTLEQLQARPIPGKWSTLEVVAHIADFEPVYADRFRRVIGLKDPVLLSADENEYVKHLHYHERDLEEELHLIEATRASTARLLSHLTAEQFQRTGVHNEKGLVTLESLLKAIANHIPNHIKFIDEKRKALEI